MLHNQRSYLKILCVDASRQGALLTGMKSVRNMCVGAFKVPVIKPLTLALKVGRIGRQ